MRYLGDFLAGQTVIVPFTTAAAAGGAVAPSSAFEAADVRVYKNASATQRSSEAGYTLTSPFDSVTGLHWLAIDLSDNTDAGFYAVGNDYTVVLVPDETVDSQTVVSVLAQFSIQNRTKGNVKKNAAFSAFQFMMTDSTNHAPATGKTVAVTRSIGAGAFAAGTLSGVTEIGNGMYAVDFAAADLNGDSVTLRATATGCDDTFERIVTEK